DDAVAQSIPVRMVARAGKKERVLAEAQTNEFGDFAIQIPPCDLDPKATIWVQVENELGEKLVAQPVDLPSPTVGATFIPLRLAARPATTDVTTEATKAPETAPAPKEPRKTGRAPRGGSKETPDQ